MVALLSGMSSRSAPLLPLSSEEADDEEEADDDEELDDDIAIVCMQEMKNEFSKIS